MGAVNTTEEPKIYTAQQVADFFLALGNETGEPITNLRLQKLLYYAQAWHLANFKRPLFNEDFEAWVHGPVIPLLYQEYKSNGGNPISVSDLSLEKVVAVFDTETKDLLDEVAGVYMNFGTWQLEKMTHVEAPWMEARGELPTDKNCSKIISKESMQKFYGERIKQG